MWTVDQGDHVGICAVIKSTHAFSAKAGFPVL